MEMNFHSEWPGLTCEPVWAPCPTSPLTRPALTCLFRKDSALCFLLRKVIQLHSDWNPTQLKVGHVTLCVNKSERTWWHVALKWTRLPGRFFFSDTDLSGQIQFIPHLLQPTAPLHVKGKNAPLPILNYEYMGLQRKVRLSCWENKTRFILGYGPCV